MAMYQEGYLQSIKSVLNERKSFERRNSEVLSYQNSLKNKSVTQIVKGVPLKIFSDVAGNVFDIEVCKDMDYATRNELYNIDPVVYEKYCNGAFRHTSVDPAILATVKGRPLDLALGALSNLR